MKRIILVTQLLLISSLLRAQYIVDVLEYVPAPGQFVNTSTAGLPVISTNSIMNGLTGCLSLGSFGGYVVFKFENPVENHPDNPYGVDFTIFGNPNAMPGTDHALTAEPGVVYVMRDDNANGLPDDMWYELAGSDHFFSDTKRNYEVTYYNPQSDVAEDVFWEDNIGNSGYVYANFYHSQPYYPLADSFPDINQDKYTLKGTLLENRVDMSNPQMVSFPPRKFGYVDNQLRGVGPFEIPDNPYTPERENSGGDAFDISWAVDENGDYVDLEKIDFVKVQCAIMADAGWIGEISTELSGAIDVEPDSSIEGVESVMVIKDMPKEIENQYYQLEACVFYMGRYVKDAEIEWSASLEGVFVDDNGMLSFNEYGDVELKASWKEDTDIYAVATTKLLDGTGLKECPSTEISIYPNPVKDYFYIDTESQYVDVNIHDIFGKLVFTQQGIMNGESVNINALSDGIYIVEIIDSESKTLFRKIVK